MLIVFNDSEQGINLLQSSLNFQQLFLNSWTLCLFRLPVEDSPAGNIPLVDYAARVEVAEDALLVLRCHDAENLDNEKYLIFQRLRTHHLAKFETVTDNVLVGDHRVGEGEDSHLPLALSTPDLNLG